MSTVVESRTQYTPEDLLTMREGKRYELVGGQLVERNMGIESSWVGGELLARLKQHSREKGIGWALPADAGYQCFPHEPDLVRRPDVSFVRFGRFPGEVLPKGWARIRPDLAVEVLSPNDTSYELDEKLEDYRKAGVPLVWVINPNSRTVRIHRGDNPVIYLREDDELSGEDVIPGFRCLVREILPLREPPSGANPGPTGPNGPG
jgi:Uma2 family endonuclease